MLSRVVEELPGSPGWAYEPKLDGFRCLLSISEFGDVRLDSRRAKPLGQISHLQALVGPQAAGDDVVADRLVDGSDSLLDGLVLALRNGDHVAHRWCFYAVWGGKPIPDPAETIRNFWQMMYKNWQS